MTQPTRNNLTLDMDAWSDGQVRSKLWLCDEIESRSLGLAPRHLWVYGSWYGTAALFLLLRNRLAIRRIQLFDLDPDAVAASRAILNHWSYDAGIRIDFHVADCNRVELEKISPDDTPDLIINTSCEHFTSAEWFGRLPRGSQFALQSTNMDHPTHYSKPSSLEDFQKQLNLASEPQYSGTISFCYPELSFDRFMIIGTK